MDCQKCKQRPASFHMEKITGNSKSELHLCELCAREQGYMTSGLSFNDLLSGLFGLEHKKTSLPKYAPCPSCAMTIEIFYKNGKLGCANCYQHYIEPVNYVLGKVQGKLEHTGKIPKRTGQHIAIKKHMTKLRKLLQSKVEQELFEEAAALRDQIKELEKEQVADERT